MRSSFAPLALVALVAANPVPQSKDDTPAPAGCSSSYSGKFTIATVNVTVNGKRSVEERQSHTPLTLSLSNGVLTDSEGRTGYIASNYQLQYNNPVQENAIYTSGFSVCSNGSLALGGSAIWSQCLSGSFYNLYQKSIGAQCSPAYLVVADSGSSPATSATVASQISDGQVTATPVPAPVTQISDGQPQATTAAAACTEYVDGQPQCSTAAAPVTTTAAACTEYKDGQPQCSTAAAPVTTAAVCTEYKDGQPQCSASSGMPVPSYGANSTISTPTPSAVPATGAASVLSISGQIFGLVAAVAAVALL